MHQSVHIHTRERNECLQTYTHSLRSCMSAAIARVYMHTDLCMSACPVTRVSTHPGIHTHLSNHPGVHTHLENLVRKHTSICKYSIYTKLFFDKLKKTMSLVDNQRRWVVELTSLKRMSVYFRVYISTHTRFTRVCVRALENSIRWCISLVCVFTLPISSEENPFV